MQLPVTFLYPWLLAFVVAVAPLLWLQRRRQSAIGHSKVGIHKNVKSVPIVGRLPAIFLTLAFAALVAALARPVIPQVSETQTIQTRDICIATDISGSMGSNLPPPTQPSNAQTSQTPSNGSGTSSQQQTYRRLDAARDAVVAFVAARDKDDRIGILVFDDESYFYWPLSNDHKIVMRKAQLINSYVGGGTNFEGPSDSNKGIGPFQACINHFRDYGKAKTKVMVIVTDGEDNISDKRQHEIAAQLEQMGIKLYVLGVGEGWTNGSTPVLGQFADKVGGKVYRVGDQAAMQQSFADINALEKSTVSIEKNTSYLDVYQYFLIAAVILLALFLGSVVLTREDA